MEWGCLVEESECAVGRLGSGHSAGALNGADQLSVIVGGQIAMK
jgi:hypothetical protein